MYYGGRPEPAHPVVAAAGIALGGCAGLCVGYVAFLLATFFPHLLHTALPAMSVPWFLAVWCGVLLVPLGSFVTVLRRGRGAGTKAYAAVAIGTLLASFALDVTGIHRMFPHETTWYLTSDVDGVPPATTR